MSEINPIRAGYHTLTPYIAVNDAKRAHEFYQRAFGATIVAVLEDRDGRIVHGALRIGDSMIVVQDEMSNLGLRAPEHGGVCSILIYTADADGLFARAVAAGATAVAPVADTFSGDRHGLLTCPFGHRWIISTRTLDISDDEIRARWRQMMAPR